MLGKQMIDGSASVIMFLFLAFKLFIAPILKLNGRCSSLHGQQMANWGRLLHELKRYL